MKRGEKKRVTGLGQHTIKGAILGLGLGVPHRTKERQQLAFEASRSMARLNAVLKKRREAWNAETER
jgi:hypothetical protein